MLRAIAIDDNKMHLNEICSIIDWNSYGVDIVKTFQNGKKALDAIDEIAPDLVLTDIMMPVMDGLELARHLSQSHPHIKIVFISSADDFDTAKTALSLNVGEYILKPLDEADVASAISNVVEKLTAEHKKNEKIDALSSIISEQQLLYAEQFFREALYCKIDRDAFADRLELLELSDLKKKTLALMDLRIVSSDDVVNDYSNSISVRSLVSEFPFEGIQSYTIQLSLNEFMLICFLDDADPYRCKSKLYWFGVSVEEFLRTKYQIEVTIAFSSASVDFSEYSALFREARRANAYGRQENHPVIAFDDTDSSNTFEKNIDFNELFDDVSSVVFSPKKSATDPFIDKYFSGTSSDGSKEYTKSVVYFIISILSTIMINEHKSFHSLYGDDLAIWKKVSNFDSIFDIRRWTKNIIDSVREFLQKEEEGAEAVIGKIKNFIKENYDKDISLYDIANSVFYSVRQANYLFKNNANMTIYEYLVEYRIEMAKKLLRTTKMKTKDIAGAVGYTSYPHFRLVFKKYTDMTPSEYKQKNV